MFAARSDFVASNRMLGMALKQQNGSDFSPIFVTRKEEKIVLLLDMCMC